MTAAGVFQKKTNVGLPGGVKEEGIMFSSERSVNQ